YWNNDLPGNETYLRKKVGSTLRADFRCGGRAEINQKALGKEKTFNQLLYLRQRIFSRVELIVSRKDLGHVPSPVKHFSKLQQGDGHGKPHRRTFLRRNFAKDHWLI